MKMLRAFEIFVLFIKIFALLFFILFVLPLLINSIFVAMNSNIIPRGNAVQVYNEYIKNSYFVAKYIFFLKKIILFM